MDELISQLNEARKQIKEKDADIAWTAQIAQDLMSQKDILSKQLESLKLENEEILMNQNNRQRDSDSLYISNLEDQFQELQLENEALKKTNASTIDALKTMEKDSRDSLKLYESSKFIVSDLESKVNKLEMKQESLLNEKNNLQIILDNHTSSSISKEGLSKLAHELTESNTTLQLENQQMKQDVEKYMITNDELGMKCTELESMLQEYQDTQEKLRDSENLAQELSTDLEILKNYSESLKQRLSLLEPESGILPTKCSRTLLDEVEDKRLELEDKNQLLAQENQKLVHKTQIGLNERHRMKNYIHTLTQSSSTRVSEEALKPLQAALSQSESEKKRLLETVKELDAKIQALTYEKQFSIYSQPDDQVLECLKIKLDQVVAENTLMKKEIRTALMLKLGETEKLRHLETVLRNERDNLAKSRASIANLKFQIEEEKNRRLFDSVLKEDKTTITNDLDWRKVDEKLIGSTIIADKKSPNKECDSFKENKAGDDVINELEHELENANPNQVKSEKQETLGAKPEKLKVKIAGGEVPKIVNIDRQKIQNNECVQQ